MDVKIIAALIALLGIALGALFSGLGYYFRTRDERLKNKREVLYHLLSFRHAIKTEFLDPEDIYNAYIEFCDELLIKKGFPESKIPEELSLLIKSHFESIVDIAKPSVSESILKEFDASLKSLSSSNPILAYQLSSNGIVKKFIDVQNSYMKNLSSIEFFDKSTDSSIKKLFSKQFKEANYMAIEGLISDVHNDIKKVSFSCDIITWYKCKKLIKKPVRLEIDFGDSELDQLLNSFLSQLADSSEIKKPNSTSQSV